MRSCIIPHELAIWLASKSMEDRISESEKGKLSVCIRCDKYFFDRESVEERNLVKCRLFGIKHECIEYANYIVLRRGFCSILDVIHYFEGDDIAAKIVRYLTRKAKGERYGDENEESTSFRN
jgi:hypothetical protein